MVMRLLFVFLSTLASLFVHAARPNFTYLEAGYLNQESDELCDQDGLFLGGRYEVNSQAFFTAGFANVDGDGSCGSESLSIGYGLRGDYGNSSTFYGLGRVIRRDYEVDDDFGVGGEFGFRSIFIEGLELNALVGFEKIDDFEQIFAGVGFDYWVAQGFSVAGNFVINDENDTSISIAARLHF